MKFIIAIEPPTSSSAYGVVVPDLPGCFSAGDTLDEALENAQETIELWFETLIEEGGNIATRKPLNEHQSNKEFDGWIWAIIDAPVERYLGLLSQDEPHLQPIV